MQAFLLYGVVSLAMLLLALVIWIKSRHIGEAEHVSKRLEGMVEEAARARLNWLQQNFERAGLNPESSRIALIICVAIPLLLLPFSAVLGFGAFVFLVLFIFLFLQWSYHKRMAKILRQLPRFLDHVVRGLYTGRTLGDAMFNAQEEVQDPLYGIIGKVKRNVSLGVALPDSFQEVADRYAVKELQVLALGIRVNTRYGGNMSDLISNIIHFIHEREKLSGQLRAMTGETRLSAVVLAVVPSAIAAFILFTNPSYLTSMWNDPSGKNWILFALGLQCSGILVIWRMMRSI